ncbi:MAG: VWA domain-containing protein [Candidatus Accumulibacter sp.]|jgi:Ca-activated chloride channel family protein|nr:VWA domain-containing protein [Accumulibacter sp.]
MSYEVGLESASGESIALKSVALKGELDGLYLHMAVTQKYRNETGKNLEIVYTFPLAFGATLMGMDVTLGARTLQACVIEKKEASDRYEKAIDEGDTPIMVEASADGLYTANLGNLLDGENLTLTLRYAQLLHFEQGQVRLHVPTVIAPRYGQAHAEGGLALHESDAVDVLAEYALSARIDLNGDIAKGRVSSPSHTIETQSTENGLVVTLRPGAKLDRDMILTISDLPATPFAIVAPDHDEQIVLASFCPQLAGRSDPITLKILVDCSGSMGGDSMRQARTALKSLVGQLDTRDYVSYSRFGSHYLHDLSKPSPCNRRTRNVLSHLVQRTQADMGGTEMEQAMLSTLQDIAVPEAAPPANVLLITDGEIWDIDSVIQAALNGGQRVFAVGVSSSPAESLLRKLSEITGGACELVSPNEDIASAILRLFYRMRGARAGKPRIEWNGQPFWQSSLPKAVYGNETLHAFARFDEKPATAPTLYWEVDGQTQSAQAGALNTVGDPDLARLGGAKQMQTTGQEEALALALKYQLVSWQTNLFLVHVREGEKATDLPVLYQVPQMMAAGWGGVTLLGEAAACESQADLDFKNETFFSRVGTHEAMKAARELREAAKALDTLALTKIADKLIEELNEAAKTKTEWVAALSDVLVYADAELKDRVIKFAVQEELAPESVWAIALEWLALRENIELSRQVKRLIRAQLKDIDDERKEETVNALSTLITQIYQTKSIFGRACETIRRIFI